MIFTLRILWQSYTTCSVTIFRASFTNNGLSVFFILHCLTFVCWCKKCVCACTDIYIWVCVHWLVWKLNLERSQGVVLTDRCGAVNRFSQSVVCVCMCMHVCVCNRESMCLCMLFSNVKAGSKLTMYRHLHPSLLHHLLILQLLFGDCKIKHIKIWRFVSVVAHWHGTSFAVSWCLTLSWLDRRGTQKRGIFICCQIRQKFVCSFPSYA